MSAPPAGTAPALVPLRYEQPRAQAMVRAFADEITARYGEDPADPEGALSTARPEDFDWPDGVFLLAVDGDGADVGCGGLRTLEPGVGEVKRMYVVPAARGRGVGRALLRALVATGRRLGHTRLLLETGTEQPEAVAMYEREGWVRVPPYGTFRDDPRSICFALDLPGAEPEPAGA